MRDHHGFGLTAMLGFCCFLGVCLLTSYLTFKKTFKEVQTERKAEQYSVNRYIMTNDYRDVSNLLKHDATFYQKIEQVLVDKAKSYIASKVNMFDQNHVIITSQKLHQEKLLHSLVDENGNSCYGYVIYSPNSSYHPYLRCQFYQTDGYQESFIS